MKNEVPKSGRGAPRATTMVRRLLRIRNMLVCEVTLEEAELLVRVRPSWHKPRCGECGAPGPGYDRSPARRWRSLNLGAVRVQFEYEPQRVSCDGCKRVDTERVPWAAHGSSFTYDFEELTAYLAQITDKTRVTKVMGINWRTVGNIVERVIDRHRDGDELGAPVRIGVDEFSYRRFHNYLTVVVDHDRRRVIWVGDGRSAESLAKFFDRLGEERCAAIEQATIDFSGGYQKAIRERLPRAEVIFDRFHVQRLASDALDEVRRAMVRKLSGSETSRGGTSRSTAPTSSRRRSHRPSTTGNPSEPAKLSTAGSAGRTGPGSSLSCASLRPSDSTGTGSSRTSARGSRTALSRASTPASE